MMENTVKEVQPSVSNTNTAPVTQDLEETVAIKEAKRKAEEKKRTGSCRKKTKSRSRPHSKTGS